MADSTDHFRVTEQRSLFAHEHPKQISQPDVDQQVQCQAGTDYTGSKYYLLITSDYSVDNTTEQG